jgi:hypothetical protein
MNVTKETVHVAVMDYCSGSIKMYSIELRRGWQVEDVKEWLYDNTDYEDTNCYYMASHDEIPVLDEGGE